VQSALRARVLVTVAAVAVGPVAVLVVQPQLGVTYVRVAADERRESAMRCVALTHFHSKCASKHSSPFGIVKSRHVFPRITAGTQTELPQLVQRLLRFRHSFAQELVLAQQAASWREIAKSIDSVLYTRCKSAGTSKPHVVHALNQKRTTTIRGHQQGYNKIGGGWYLRRVEKEHEACSLNGPLYQILRFDIFRRSHFVTKPKRYCTNEQLQSNTSLFCLPTSRDVPGPKKSKTRVRVSNFKFRGSGSGS